MLSKDLPPILVFNASVAVDIALSTSDLVIRSEICLACAAKPFTGSLIVDSKF